jgi:hypothetical protein
MSSVFRDTMEARRSGRVAADCKSVLKRLVGSNLTASTKIWLDRIKVITSDCLSDYRGSIPRRVAKQFRETRARCMGVTVNHWLEEFDPLTRSQF